MRNPLMARFAGSASLVAAESLEWFQSCLHAAAGHERLDEMLAERASSDDGFWPAPDDWQARYRPYVVVDGMLQIPVKGVLLNDFPYAIGGWITGYTYIERAFERGARDFTNGVIKGIALVIDSPGGMVAGCFDAVDKMMALKGDSGVPVRAFAHESAYSAAYAIASVADHIAVSRTGGVGSVGVVTMHVDVSEALSQDGIKITYIFAGKHKVDGNPYQELPPEVKARIQTRIDALYDVFVGSVSRNRGMDEQAVRDSEALTFTAAEAVSNGFADSVGSLDDALAAYAVVLSSNPGDETMADQADTSAADHAAAITAARAEGVTEGAAAGRTAGLAEGAAAERARINGILASDAGKARPKAALAAALKSDMSLETATAFLADLAEESPAAEGEGAGTGFDAAMNEGNPELGAGNGNDEAEDPVAAVAALAASVGLKGFARAAAK